MTGPEIVALVDEGLGNSSYVVDLGDGRAMVVDPARNPGRTWPRRRSGGCASHCRSRPTCTPISSPAAGSSPTGSRVVAAVAADLEHPHRGLADGEEMDLGGLNLVALATPGHTPEHLAYLLRDGNRPVALFSGGSLLVGAVARTDLTSSERTEELARSLWRSIQDRILTLPDDLAVYPTHGAGSFCSVAPGGERMTTIGRERASNPLLAAPDEDAFVARLLTGFGTFPPYFLEMREVNRRGPQVYGRWPAIAGLDVGPFAASSTTERSSSTCARSSLSPPATSPDRCPSRCAPSSPAGWGGW